MDTEEKLKLIKEVGEEIIGFEELKKLFEAGKPLIAYDGFEPSGQMHLAAGLLRVININKMVAAGIQFKMLVADWHALANNKMGGDLEKIQTVGKYFIEVWKAAGLNTENVEFVWASELVKDPNYWMTVMRVAKSDSVNRIIRTSQIMGRKETEELTAAQILYPCMQAADIFTLGANITELGMDQRKVNMLAREIGDILGYWKPIVISHHMLMWLGKPVQTTDKVERAIEMKMSKSNPDSAIFMTDTYEDIERKINKAYCPEGEIKDNPVLEYAHYIIFEKFDQILIERPDKFGGNLSIHSYEQLEKMYEEKAIHPMDLKKTVISLIDKLLQPIREHFVQDEYAKQLLEKVKSYQVTR
jgi:tyrosyl-tRNA synthetase